MHGTEIVERPKLPNVVGDATDEMLQAAYPELTLVDAPDCLRKYWVIGDGTITEMTQAEKDAVDADEQAAQEAFEAQMATAQAEAFGQLCAKIGPMVTALQSNLASFGLSLPTTKGEAMGAIMAASLAGGLTDEQKESKSDAGLLYVMLAGQGITDEQINAVWQYLEAQE